MPGPAPKTDKWTARENRHKPSGLHLLVSGAVQASNPNVTPRLAEAARQGSNPKVLVLDLSLDSSGGPDGIGRVWKPVDYHKVVNRDQYAGVDIQWDGKSIASCKVLDDAEHFQHLVALTQAANAKFAKKPSTAAKPKGANAAKRSAGKPAAKRKTAASPKKTAASSKRKTAPSSKRTTATGVRPKKGSTA